MPPQKTDQCQKHVFTDKNLEYNQPKSYFYSLIEPKHRFFRVPIAMLGSVANEPRPCTKNHQNQSQTEGGENQFIL